jgi:hypothetical protein
MSISTSPVNLACCPDATLKVPLYGLTYRPWARATAELIRDIPAPVSTMARPLLGADPPRTPTSMDGWGSESTPYGSQRVAGSSSNACAGMYASTNCAAWVAVLTARRWEMA